MLTLNMINYQDKSIAVKGAISHRNLHLRLPMTFVLIAKLIRTLSPSHSRHHNNILSMLSIFFPILNAQFSQIPHLNSQRVPHQMVEQKITRKKEEMSCKCYCALFSLCLIIGIGISAFIFRDKIVQEYNKFSKCNLKFCAKCASFNQDFFN